MVAKEEWGKCTNLHQKERRSTRRNNSKKQRSDAGGDETNKKVVSLDQVGVADLGGTMGIGGYKYAMVICKVAEDYLDFVPSRL